MKIIMLKKFIYIISFCLSCTFVLAQEESNLVSISKISLGLRSISFDYQAPVANSFVLDSKLGIGASARIEKGVATLDYLRSAIFFSSELRYLYSYDKRKNLGKNTLYNSASFLGIKTNYQLKSLNKKNDLYSGNNLSIAGIWGLQRSLNKNFLFNLHLGAGWVNDFNTKNSIFYPEVGVGFSYILTK
ncbi:hypothetical protein FO675_01415 [Riemerella anatipestifer]|uniref:hypothetical protein n=1 Tax=Riemerella anatipestifer TaxID=34085 RepID=UPI001AD69896|nr:hypothetical protein [Riemerella anatipestifer]MBO4232973.1 hypothetical protein [Riemerella anatipestifer]MDY3316415.1 hypothetical protein [Riemerella anatipestifer]